MAATSRIRKWKIALGFLACGWLSAGCREKPKEEPPPVRPVKMQVVKRRPKTVVRKYPGEVRPNQWVDLAFEVPGRVIELPVKRGDIVRKGQLLARLDPLDYENAVLAAKASVAQARAHLGRIEVAVKTGAVSKQDLTDAQAALAVAEAALRIREKALRDTKLYAPFDGVIAEKLVENFWNVQAKQKILVLQEIETLNVVINVPEEDFLTANKENLGKFTATFSLIPGKKFDLKIKELTTDADPITQTYAVTFYLNAPHNLNQRILPGMTAQVTWLKNLQQGKENSGVVVPVTAVLNKEGKTAQVWVVDTSAMTVKARKVKIGPVVDTDEIVVLEGLKDGETIAVAGVHFLREGMKVRKLVSEVNEGTETK